MRMVWCLAAVALVATLMPGMTESNSFEVRKADAYEGSSLVKAADTKPLAQSGSWDVGHVAAKPLSLDDGLLGITPKHRRPKRAARRYGRRSSRRRSTSSSGRRSYRQKKQVRTRRKAKSRRRQKSRRANRRKQRTSSTRRARKRNRSNARKPKKSKSGRSSRNPKKNSGRRKSNGQTSRNKGRRTSSKKSKNGDKSSVKSQTGQNSLSSAQNTMTMGPQAGSGMMSPPGQPSKGRRALGVASVAAWPKTPPKPLWEELLEDL